MAFINCGATDRTGGLFASKAALKRAFDADPSSVLFVGTAQALGPALGDNGLLRGDEILAKLPAGTTLVVVGPNPATDRRWYGNVKVVKGVVKIS